MHLAARLVLQTVAALLRDVPDVEPGFILIGNLDQFKLRFRYVDGFGGGCFELYSVHVRVAGLVNFLDRADLASLRKCDDVIVNEPGCAHKSLFLIRCRQHEGRCLLQQLPAAGRDKNEPDDRCDVSHSSRPDLRWLFPVAGTESGGVPRTEETKEI